MTPASSINLTLSFDQDGELISATCPQCERVIFTQIAPPSTVEEKTKGYRGAIALLHTLSVWHETDCKKPGWLQ